MLESVAYLALILSIICLGITISLFYYLNELIVVFNEMVSLYSEEEEEEEEEGEDNID